MDIKKNKKENWQGPVYQLFATIIGWIIGPIIIALFLGNWLDAKYSTGNRYLLICVIIAFIITNIGLIKVSFKTIKKIDEQAKKDISDNKEENKD